MNVNLCIDFSEFLNWYHFCQTGILGMSCLIVVDLLSNQFNRMNDTIERQIHIMITWINRSTCIYDWNAGWWQNMATNKFDFCDLTYFCKSWLLLWSVLLMASSLAMATVIGLHWQEVNFNGYHTRDSTLVFTGFAFVYSLVVFVGE